MRYTWFATLLTATAKERTMVQPSVSPKKKLRVLIADDVQETRRNTRLMLATIDDVEVVAIAANGIQAVELTEEHHPDILLLDINMPEMDGLTAYRKRSEERRVGKEGRSRRSAYQ